MAMEIGELFEPLRRWWWLLLACTIVAAVSSLFVVSQQPPIYISRTTLMIGRLLEDPNPNSSQFYLAQQLASTYADIANREPIREATKQALGINFLPGYQARALPNSQLIEIAVTDTNPQRAFAIASELANQLIARGPTSDGETDQVRREFIETQLDILQTQIKNTQDEIEELTAQLSTLNSARQIADTESQIATLTSGLTALRSNYAGLLANTQQGAFNILNIIEPANLPNTPVGPNRMTTVLLSASVGFALAAGAAYLLEYLDKSVKSVEEIARLVPSPRIGVISEMGKDVNTWSVVANQPRSRTADEFRILRTNLEFMGFDSPIHSVLVTSSNSGEGKSTIAVNLAFILAQAGKKVILIDADFRKPNIHKILGISNRIGLSDAFREKVDVMDCVVKLEEHGLEIISSGPLPPNPTDLLSSSKMNKILEELQSNFDLLIIDGPPLLVADAAVLSSKVSGVLLVVQPGYTQKAALKTIQEQLKTSRARLLGVVVNRTSQNVGYYYGGYYEKQKSVFDLKSVDARAERVEEKQVNP
jgi:polysaccharide biosynthesis transport protein